MTETTMRSAGVPAVRKTAPKKGGNWLQQVGVTLLIYIIYAVIMGVGVIGYLLADMVPKGAADGDMFTFSFTMEELPTECILIMLWTQIFMIVLFVIYAVKFQKRPAAAMGFTARKALPLYLTGFAAGLLAYSGSLGLCYATGAVSVVRSDGISVPFLLLFAGGWMIQGLAEEVMCRGFLMTSINRHYPVWAGVVINSALFAVLHAANPGAFEPLAMINLFLFGLFASLLFLRTRSIWICGAFHSAWNLVQGNFWGVPVSGIPVTSFFVTASDESSGLINGGTFGLEGGLAVTVVMVGAIAVLLATSKKKGTRTPDIAV